MTDVTILGTGTVGSDAAERLREAGHTVTTWRRADGPVAGAVRARPLILVAVTDHAAVREVLTAAGAGLAGRTAVALCTGTPDDARTAARLVASHGGDYLDAGVSAPGSYVYSGPRDVYERHRPALEAAGEAVYAGTDPAAAAVWDLALFGLWYDAQLGLLRALATARRAGIDVAAFAGGAAIQLGHVVDGLPGTVSALRDGVYPPGPAPLDEHLPVIRHLIGLRAGDPLGEGGLTPVADLIERLGDSGRQGLTRLAAPAQVEKRPTP